MAFLRSIDDATSVYLLALHKIGRASHTVDTTISDPTVSRLHSLFYWNGSAWQISDMSLNGTWLNGKKLVKESKYPIGVGDHIQFGNLSGPSFKVENIAPPKDYLSPCSGYGKGTRECIPLDTYNLLPNDDSPELALYMDYSHSRWCLEPVGRKDFDSKVVHEGERLHFCDEDWTLSYNRADEKTVAIEEQRDRLTNIEFVFHLSMDEESTQLTLHKGLNNVSLNTRTHHYLTLTLARKKAADISANIDESEQGWMYTERLARDLGLTETHLNIQIHRARKQLIEALDYDLDAEHFIQRRGGKVRLGVNKFTVIKGSARDCSSEGIISEAMH